MIFSLTWATVLFLMCLSENVPSLCACLPAECCFCPCSMWWFYFDISLMFRPASICFICLPQNYCHMQIFRSSTTDLYLSSSVSTQTLIVTK